MEFLAEIFIVVGLMLPGALPKIWSILIQ